jgi:hypothetical protein
MTEMLPLAALVVAAAAAAAARINADAQKSHCKTPTKITAQMLSLSSEKSSLKLRKWSWPLPNETWTYGRYEADSLLRLSDGGDDHILAHIMCFLDVNDVGRAQWFVMP